MKGVEIYGKMSVTLNLYKRHSTPLRETFIEENLSTYQDDEKIKHVNGFVCTFPASMCQLWMAFENKSIVFMPAHRYNLGRCTVQDWNLLNKQLKKMEFNEKDTIAAMSRYDLEYLKYYTGIEALLVPSYSGFYFNSVYNPQNVQKGSLLIFGHRKPYIIDKVQQATKSKFQANFVYDLYQRYEISDLLKHQAIIFFPYSVMSFKLTELYSLAIPLFMPSPQFFKNNGGLGHDRTSTSYPYCETDPQLEEKMRPKLNLHPRP